MRDDDGYFGELANKYLMRVPGSSKSENHHNLYILLKEVSRDTRHACAEVRAENPYQGQIHEQASDYPEYFDKGFQAGQEAHADACMNVGGGKP